MITGQQALELIKETLEGQESRIAELEAEKAALDAANCKNADGDVGKRPRALDYD